MKKKHLILFIIIFSIGCTTPIRRIVKHPEKLDGRRVKIKGKVVSSLYLEDLQIFYLEDKIGNNTIPVVTEYYLPLKNDYIKVRGRVKNNYSYNGKKPMVVVFEKDTLINKSPDNTNYNKRPRYKYINNRFFKFKNHRLGHPDEN